MKNCDILRGQFKKPHRLANGLPRAVHIGFWLEQDHLLAAQNPFADLALKFAAPRREPMVCSNMIQGHEPDIVTVLAIFRAGISKTNPKFHSCCDTPIARPMKGWCLIK